MVHVPCVSPFGDAEQTMVAERLSREGESDRIWTTCTVDILVDRLGAWDCVSIGSVVSICPGRHCMGGWEETGGAGCRAEFGAGAGATVLDCRIRREGGR